MKGSIAIWYKYHMLVMSLMQIALEPYRLDVLNAWNANSVMQCTFIICWRKNLNFVPCIQKTTLLFIHISNINCNTLKLKIILVLCLCVSWLLVIDCECIWCEWWILITKLLAFTYMLISYVCVLEFYVSKSIYN